MLAKAEAKAASMGMDRAKYVRSLIEDDLASGSGAGGRRFVSEDLVGIHTAAEPVQAATNERVREALKRRAVSRHEAHR